MTSIVDESDEVVAAAWAVLRGDAPQGTERVRAGETEDGASFVYRIDPEVSIESIDPETVTVDGEFPDAEATLWRANRDEVRREVGRRDIEGTSRSTAGEAGGNR